MDKLIGRERECAMLTKIAQSNRPEFVAIYGRRRVGKTFLVRRQFNDKFVFFATGVMDGTPEDQMAAFNIGLSRYGYTGPEVNDWMSAFDALDKLLAKKCKRRTTRQVVFIDELPCFDTEGSNFKAALDHFWESSASWRDNIMFVVCGSATSWMLDNLIYSHAGLHKRLTYPIHLSQFDLATTEEYCKSRRCKWGRLSILQAYSIFGGVPYYWSLMDFDKTVAENVDDTFFREKATLESEYDVLFRALYKNPEPYVAIIQELAKVKKGMTRVELAKALKKHDNGHFGELLTNLCECDFIRRYNNGENENGGIYQLMDFFILFYHQFGHLHTTDNHYWEKHIGSPEQNNWYGLAFERVAMTHFRHVIQALHWDTIHTEFYSWRSKKSDSEAQIDMVIDRGEVCAICEMKYSQSDYALDKDEARRLSHREVAFKEVHPKLSWTQIVLITTFGLKQNSYSEMVQKVITMDDLFVVLRD